MELPLASVSQSGELFLHFNSGRHFLVIFIIQPLPRLEGASDIESEHSDDSAGEKEAKRQRSEPTTSVSTSSRHPYDYDALMGITRVGTKEAEGFEEDLDSTEYHDATEEPVRKGETDDPQLKLRSAGFQGGFGSSSLKECIELLDTRTRKQKHRRVHTHTDKTHSTDTRTDIQTHKHTHTHTHTQRHTRARTHTDTQTNRDRQGQTAVTLAWES